MALQDSPLHRLIKQEIHIIKIQPKANKPYLNFRDMAFN